jgi:hypothetical protein
VEGFRSWLGLSRGMSMAPSALLRTFDHRRAKEMSDTADIIIHKNFLLSAAEIKIFLNKTLA